MENLVGILLSLPSTGHFFSQEMMMDGEMMLTVALPLPLLYHEVSSVLLVDGKRVSESRDNNQALLLGMKQKGLDRKDGIGGE